MPAGFARITVESRGFSILAPAEAELRQGKGDAFQLNAVHDGIQYRVQDIEMHGGPEPNKVAVLRTATKYVGNDCQPKLRLHGRYETEGVVHVRLDTICKDGTAYHGILHFWDGKVVVATTIEKLARDSNPVLEPFLFSFQRATN